MLDLEATADDAAAKAAAARVACSAETRAAAEAEDEAQKAQQDVEKFEASVVMAVVEESNAAAHEAAVLKEEVEDGRAVLAEVLSNSLSFFIGVSLCVFSIKTFSLSTFL
jgi:hypothetical protein